MIRGPAGNPGEINSGNRRRQRTGNKRSRQDAHGRERMPGTEIIHVIRIRRRRQESIERDRMAGTARGRERAEARHTRDGVSRFVFDVKSGLGGRRGSEEKGGRGRGG
jgi:hypothetical protein